MSPIEAGQPVPDFTLPRDGGGETGPADFKGRKLVIYFYPKDDTSGCTLEAIDFSARIADFESANTAVLGISRDSVKSHDRFRDKHGLKVVLLSDTTGAICERFGVWAEKSMYGRKYMGIERSTFLVDAKGIVAEVWRKVGVPGHVGAVLEASQKL